MRNNSSKEAPFFFYNEVRQILPYVDDYPTLYKLTEKLCTSCFNLDNQNKTYSEWLAQNDAYIKNLEQQIRLFNLKNANKQQFTNNTNSLNLNNMDNKIFKYESNSIAFEFGQNFIKINATEMAKPFGESKQPVQWLRSESAKEFIAALSELRNCSSADLLDIRKGGKPNEQGTWMHEDLAIEFARWLNPMFGIWCNDRIKELLTKGKVEIRENELGKLVTDAATQVGGKTKLSARTGISAHIFGYAQQSPELISKEMAAKIEKVCKQVLTQSKGFDSEMQHFLQIIGKTSDDKDRSLLVKMFSNIMNGVS